MGLFDFMKGKKENVIAAPVKGECIPISEVADPTFAEEILGKGMAIKVSFMLRLTARSVHCFLQVMRLVLRHLKEWNCSSM